MIGKYSLSFKINSVLLFLFYLFILILDCRTVDVNFLPFFYVGFGVNSQFVQNSLIFVKVIKSLI